MSTPIHPTGLRLPTLALLALLAAGCGEGNLVGVDQGVVRFVITEDASVVTAAEAASADASIGAAPGDAVTSFDGDHERGYGFFQSINVTFASIVARNFDGVLVDVEMELPVDVDVNTMEEGRQIVLPDGELPPATYDQLVVVMTQVQGVTRDGTTITIEPPGGGWTAIVPVCPFTVEDGATTVVGLGFNLRHSLKWREGRYFFQPHFRCETDEEPADTP